jgi:hypothetical protein
MFPSRKTVTPAMTQAMAEAMAGAAPTTPPLVFERLNDAGLPGLAVFFRAKVPGGWLVALRTDEVRKRMLPARPDPRLGRRLASITRKHAHMRAKAPASKSPFGAGAWPFVGPVTALVLERRAAECGNFA